MLGLGRAAALIRTMAANMIVFSRTWGIGEPTHDIGVDVKWVRREHQAGWYLHRRDNGHRLGMVGASQGRRGRNAYVLNQAFYPVDADLMERTAKHPRFQGDTWATGHQVDAGCPTLSAAAFAILSHLAEQAAVGVEDLIEAHRHNCHCRQGGSQWAS